MTTQFREQKLFTVAQIYKALCENKVVHGRYRASGVLCVLRGMDVFEDGILLEIKNPNFLSASMYSNIKNTIDFFILVSKEETSTC